MRKFGSPSIEMARSWINEYQVAERHADEMVSYEDLVGNPHAVVARLCAALEIELSVDELVALLPGNSSMNLSAGEYSASTLLHKNHRTGTVAGEWREVLDERLIDDLHHEFHWWFRETGYEI
jgi:hypothetical protein